MAVKAFVASQPVANPAGVQVTLDEGDRPFKSLAENCQAIKDAARNRGGKRDPRLDRIEAKALGAGVGIPADGGYLLEPTITAALIKPMHETGPFLPAAQKLPVSSNSNYGWINGVDETSRVAGSRWGGVQGYRVAEGGTITSSKIQVFPTGGAIPKIMHLPLFCIILFSHARFPPITDECSPHSSINRRHQSSMHRRERRV